MSTVVFILIGLAACGFTRGLFNNSASGLMWDLFLGVIGHCATQNREQARCAGRCGCAAGRISCGVRHVSLSPTGSALSSGVLAALLQTSSV